MNTYIAIVLLFVLLIKSWDHAFLIIKWIFLDEVQWVCHLHPDWARRNVVPSKRAEIAPAMIPQLKTRPWTETTLQTRYLLQFIIIILFLVLTFYIYFFILFNINFTNVAPIYTYLKKIVMIKYVKIFLYQYQIIIIIIILW